MAEADLTKLLANLDVHHLDGVWQFVTYERGIGPKIRAIPRALNAIMMMKEREGMTLIVPADDDTPPDNRWVWLELSVFSDLQAVGFLAEVAKALTEAGVPCNAVAAYHHDHIFVPENKVDAAMTALRALSGR